MKTRKELVVAYKNQKFPMGVFQVRNTANGRVFLDSGLNMPSLWNRHRFQLDFGNHPNLALQADWNAFGEASFAFEVLSELKPREEDGVDYRKELKVLEALVFDEIKPFGQTGYHVAPRPT